MKVVQCKNRHYFDADEYDVCPICGRNVKSQDVSSNPLRKKKPKKIPDQREQAGAYIDSNGDGQFQSGSNETVRLITEGMVAADPRQEKVTRTEDDNKSEKSIKEESLYTSVKAIKSDEKHAEDADPSSLCKVVKNVSANNAGETISYFNVVAGETKDERKKKNVNPVVGWIVGIKGYYWGDSFKISAGKNSIGRSEENRIVLNQDGNVSRIKHAFIVYEPKKREFYLQPGDGSGLTYLNDEYVTETKRLSPKDVIALGESEFLFVPLCGETFTWEDYMQGSESNR